MIRQVSHVEMIVCQSEMKNSSRWNDDEHVRKRRNIIWRGY